MRRGATPSAETDSPNTCFPAPRSSSRNLNTRSCGSCGPQSWFSDSSPFDPGSGSAGASAFASSGFTPSGSPSNEKRRCSAGNVPKLRTTASTTNGRPARGTASDGIALVMTGSGGSEGRSLRNLKFSTLSSRSANGWRTAKFMIRPAQPFLPRDLAFSRSNQYACSLPSGGVEKWSEPDAVSLPLHSSA